MKHSLVIQPSNYTPNVNFDTSGTLSLKGRSLMLDAITFYEPLINWLIDLTIPSIHFTIELDYFNTSSSKKLLEMLNIIDCNNKIKEFIVYWGFEPDDEEILIKGQILEERLKNARFSFKELAGV